MRIPWGSGEAEPSRRARQSRPPAGRVKPSPAVGRGGVTLQPLGEAESSPGGSGEAEPSRRARRSRPPAVGRGGVALQPSGEVERVPRAHGRSGEAEQDFRLVGQEM